MIVDDGVQERCADEWAVLAASLSGSQCLRAAIGLALLAGEEPMPAAVGDVAELGHVDMDHRPWIVMFVTTDRLPGNPIDAAESVEPTTHQHGVDGRSRHAELTGDLRRS
ncbi:hypothetical protein GCM10010213_24970 [Microbacterium maritypicum]|nr:hypothetical protein GCM10010213_24970 [Microbacterium liquefaciens]